MAAMTKYVNVRTTVAVRNTEPPICGAYTGIMTTGDILKCLCKRAKVEEVLPDGKTVRLNMQNYYLDNGAGLDARVHHPVKKEVVENPKRFVVPVAHQEAQVVETKTEEPVHEEVKADECVTVVEEPALTADEEVLPEDELLEEEDAEEETEVNQNVTPNAPYTSKKNKKKRR